MSTSASTSVPNNTQHHSATTTATSSSTEFSHPTTTGYAPNENQLAGLVEAATAAAGQDVSPEWAAAAAVAAAAGTTGNHNQLDGYGGDMHIEDDGFGGDAGFGGMSGGGGGSGKGYKGSVGAEPVSASSGGKARKRKREEDPLDPALTAASAEVGFGGQQQQQQQQNQHQHQQSQHHSHQQQQQRRQHGHQRRSGIDGDDLEVRGLPPQSMSEVRAAGVHSAAALFRQPSSNKRYTRPPMSKMFSSLELSPENFLHLQAAAKIYMLDDNHPERRDCVGQRGKGDTEMVKLRLWNCVRNFLEAEGNGERFFGESAPNEGMPPRTYVWPRDQQQIISLVIPLLRRMVTNERQRQYAVETRKGGGLEERRRRKTEDDLQNLGPSQQYTPEEQLQMHHSTQDNNQLTCDFAAQLALPPSQQQMEQTPEAQAAELGLTELFADGYQTDWNAFARAYDMYNQGYELDNLWSISGLQQPVWRGLVAAIDSHYQMVHNGSYECPPACENEFVDRMISSDALLNLRWRIGGDRNQSARNEFASSITRDVLRIVHENLAAARNGGHLIVSPHAHPPPSSAVSNMEQPPVDSSSSQGPQPPPSSFVNDTPAPGGRSQPSANETNENENNPAYPNINAPPSSSNSPYSLLNLLINILYNNKRISSSLTVPADICPDLETLRGIVSRRLTGQLSISSDAVDSASQSQSAWKVKVLLPDGLVSVTNDGEWTVALLSGGNVDWFDGDLRVVVDVGG